jgi:ZIP family zinc transporter
MIATFDAGTWIAVVALASLSVVSTATGICLARRVGDRPGVQALGIGFSVGVMVAISLGELLPVARAEAGLTTTALWAIAGAAVVGLLHFVIPHIHLVEESRGAVVGSARVAYLVAFGLILHDVPEGFAMANAYVSTTRLGVLVAVALVLHNIPEEFVMALPAVVAGRRRFLRRAAIASAAAEPVGALLGLIGVGAFPSLNAGLLAVASGAMLFVSFHELVPMARRLGHHRDTTTGAAGGVLVWWLLGQLISP